MPSNNPGEGRLELHRSRNRKCPHLHRKAQGSAETLVQMYETERLNIVDYRNIITLKTEAAYS
jgi:hypothetical protein